MTSDGRAKKKRVREPADRDASPAIDTTGSLDSVKINPALRRALAGRNFAELTPVQAAVLAEAATGRDLLVSAQTGSGKTVAYGLALASTLLGEAETFEAPAAPLALVVAPTRELALQVQRELGWLYAEARARVAACVGGMDTRREARDLAAGTHVVVGTPGRLRDHLERGRLDLSSLRAVVLDEADEMLDLGFREDLEFILGAMPTARRTLLFSATLPKAIVALAQSFGRDMLRMAVAGSGGSGGHADIAYRAIRVLPREITHAIVNTLRLFEASAALVFCNTREAVRHLQALLSERGFAVVALSGELSQNERNHALVALRDGRARVCVATDVAARGIDLPGLDLVIHADLPHDAEALQHRSGRTGRAGRKGTSVLLVPPSRRRKADQMMAGAGIVPVWSGPPQPDEIRRLDQERLLDDPIFTETPGDEDLALAAALLAGRAPETVAVALARLYRQRLPAPEDAADPGFAPPPREPRGPTPAGRGEAAGEGVWFVLNIGRADNADPKWLLPMLCRRGGITKADIGPIRIFDRETKILVRDDAARRFERSVRGTDVAGIRIQPVGGGEPQGGGKPRRREGHRGARR